MVRKRASKLVDEYRTKRGLYRDFSTTVESLIWQLLTEGNYKFQLLKSREKESEKLDEKIERKKKEGTIYKTLGDIEDLAGVRVVFYLESQKDEFVQVIEKEFEKKDLRVLSINKPGGYKATHCIFALDSGRAKLPEYRRFKGLKCEIQITSSLYHAWSEIEHDITYKPIGPRKSLNELGIDELKVDLERTMTNYIVPAVVRFEQHNKLYQAIRKGADIFNQRYSFDKMFFSSSNDEIFGLLEIIENFPQKKSDEIANIIQKIIAKKPSKPVVIGKFGKTEFLGKTHKDVLLKSIDLIKKIRYYSTEKVLTILSDLLYFSDKGVRENAAEALKVVSRFDYDLLTKSNVGYSYQRLVINYIKKWPVLVQLSKIEFILVVTKELLKSSVEGSEMTDERTVRMHFTHVAPTDGLKKLRKEAINLVFDLYSPAPGWVKTLAFRRRLQHGILVS